MFRVEAVDPVEHLPDLREVQAEVRQHVRVLRPLAGEHEDKVSLPAQRFGRVVDPRDGLDSPAVRRAQLLDRLPQLQPEVVRGARDDRKAKWPLYAAQRAAEGEGEIR